MNCEDVARMMANYPVVYDPYTYRASVPPGMTPPAGQPMPMPMAYGTPYAAPATGTVPQATEGTTEESYIENILRFNHGKIGTFYFTYQGNSKWNAMIYRGRVETAGRDHIIISDPKTGKRYLLLMANLDWVEFDEKINYPYPKIAPEVKSQLTTSD